MSWKKSLSVAGLAVAMSGLVLAPRAHAEMKKPEVAPAIKAVDADNHNIVLNKPGLVSVIIGTSEDSQDAARRAGRAMYPFQGLSDFQLVVVVDLRDSIASWVPSVVINHMRRSLDQEAVELRPYYLKNGNKSNPRKFCHVVPDFKGTVMPKLNWGGTPDQLHAIIYGPDGREVKRWDAVTDMNVLAVAVHGALEDAYLAGQRAHSPAGR